MRRHASASRSWRAATATTRWSGSRRSRRAKDIRLVYFGVGATPVRARKAEAALAGGSVDDAVKALDLEPTSDVHATSGVKKHLAGVLLRRVAGELLGSA